MVVCRRLCLAEYFLGGIALSLCCFQLVLEFVDVIVEGRFHQGGDFKGWKLEDFSGRLDSEDVAHDCGCLDVSVG